MSPKRGDRAAPPPIAGEYDLRFANADAAEGWEQLSRQVAANLRRAYERIRSAPRGEGDFERQHRLKGALASGVFKGQENVGSRIWYLIDEERRTAWIIHAGTGHPKATD